MAKLKNATKLSRKHIITHKIHKITSDEYWRVFILRTIGNFLLLSSLFMIGKTFYEPVREEIRYFVDNVAQKKYYVADVKLSNKPPDIGPKQPVGLLAKTLRINPVEVLTPTDVGFSIVVPKIAANAKIIANVDAADEKVYLDVLQRGVAHALGTAFPGEGGHVFLFAHSTDYFWNVGTYNAVFYLLGKLEKGDEINIFYKNQRYVYKVQDKIVVDPSRADYLTRKSNKEFLTLQTCWPIGTTLKRLLVFATRVAD